MADLKDKLDQIQQKAKERTVKTQNIEYDLETLVKKINKGVIRLNPDYQRNHRWSSSISSRLIESLILNIPIPIIYISQDIDVDTETDDGVARYSVIDGQQRLTAIYEYIKNEFALKEMDILTELNGLSYSELPPFLIRRLEERSIKCLRIDSTVDTQVKYDIFERLNSGSVKLEAQELRNATCRGPFNKLLKKLSKNSVFVEVCNLKPDSAKVKKMENEELILRYFAMTYKDGYRDYKSKFKVFLTNKMKAFNELSEIELESMEKNFVKTFKGIRTLFGDKPFSKYKFENNEYKRVSSFNVAVFDSIVVGFNYLDKSLSYADYKELFKVKKFYDCIEGSTNDVLKVVTRIELAKAIFV